MATLFGTAALVGLVLLAPGRSTAENREPDPLALRKAQDEFARLREELARVDAEVAQLKRADRSVRSDYRLRERMADAEALAQKVSRAEERLRSLGRPANIQPTNLPLQPPPQESPQDGSVELEAKADLFADQANKLAHQADTFTRAADQLRTRKALRRRASAWDRDPFAGLESSKRNLATSSSTTKMAGPSGAQSGDSASRSGASPTTVTQGPSTTTGSTVSTPPTSSGSTFTGGSAPSSESSGKSSSGVGAIESPASKSSPLAPGVSADRQLEQRLFLDPTTAAELRQVLGAGVAISDPETLDRAAAALRARARELGQRADAIRRKIHAP